MKPLPSGKQTSSSNTIEKDELYSTSVQSFFSVSTTTTTTTTSSSSSSDLLHERIRRLANISVRYFFDIIYSVHVKEPGYFEGCADQYGNVCKNTVNKECAFVTATRIRQKAWDHIVNDVTNTIGVITLPISIGAVGTARGLQFLKHGFFIANDVASLAIGLDQEGFTAKCQAVFGEEAGQAYSSNIIGFTAFIGGFDLVDGLADGIETFVTKNTFENVPFSTLATFNYEEQIQLIANARYAAEAIDASGQVIVEPKMLAIVAQMEKTLKKKLTGPTIEEALNLIIRPLFPSIEGLDILSDEAKNIRNLIHRYRDKQINVNGVDIDPSHRIDNILEGMSETEIQKLLDNLDNDTDSDLINYLIGGSDQMSNSVRMESWKLLSSYPNSNDLVLLMKMELWIGIEVQSLKIGSNTNFSYLGKEFAKIDEDGILIFLYPGWKGDQKLNPNKNTIGLGKWVEDPDNYSTSFGTKLFLEDPPPNGLPDGVIGRVTSEVPPANSLTFLDLPAEDYNLIINNEIKSAILNSYPNANVSSITDQDYGIVESLIKNDILPNVDESALDIIILAGVDSGKNIFWIDYNLPFLKKAFERGDDIRLFSDPVEFGGSGLYGKELLEINKPDGLADFYDYSYNQNTGIYSKN
ncbi:MAG: hypothetical protein ACI86M_001103 [Saprospiraceae bacterium]|jgi:hypothetical protein